MKKHLKISVILLLGIFLMAGSAIAIPSTSVMMIDGVGDGVNASVNILSSDTSDYYDFGFINPYGDFEEIVSGTENFGFYTFEGGKIVDFSIRDSVGVITRASEGTAKMYFSGYIDASFSENPTVTDNYWQNFSITWEFCNNDMVINISGPFDGFAPAPAPAPEPATMLLLGSGLLGLAGMGRKKFFER